MLSKRMLEIMLENAKDNLRRANADKEAHYYQGYWDGRIAVILLVMKGAK